METTAIKNDNPAVFEPGWPRSNVDRFTFGLIQFTHVVHLLTIICISEINNYRLIKRFQSRSNSRQSLFVLN